jgi:ribosome biogenesis GTPase
VTDLPGALARYGWNERVLALFNTPLFEPGSSGTGSSGTGSSGTGSSCAPRFDDLPGEPPGATTLEPARVVRVERTSCVVVGPDGAARTVRAAVLPAVGDWATIAAGAVREVLPRWSAIRRADPSGSGEQVLAANVDLVLVAAPADRLSPPRVERELALAWESGATPLVLLTKCDLAADELWRQLAARLVGADVAPVSARDGSGLAALRARLRPARTGVLIGPSGAGKSSLLNALAGGELTATADVRPGDRRGRHTTASRQLVVLEGGGVLIDTPGLRSLGLGAGAPLGPVFPDIASLAAGCRFDDCRHEREPGCAVSRAVMSGELDPARLRSFRKLERELAAEARRTDPVARKAEQRRRKAISKEVRRNDKRLRD